MMNRIARTAVVCGLALLPAELFAASFTQTNLVSDLPGVANNLDTNLVNSWGLTAGPTTPFWISDNGTGMSTVYNGAGQPFPTASPIIVSIPGPGGIGSGAPTGVVFNSDVSSFGGAHFIFSTEDGTIAGWSSGNSAVIDVDNSASSSVYKGLATANSQIYATNFHNGSIDVFDSSFAPVSMPGGFVDPNLPSGYAPFNIANINGLLYVTYALQDATKEDDVAGMGHGFIDVYDTSGVLQKRLVSDGDLNSPWGLALAPASFDGFGGDLLVGNFGDGTIHAYDAMNGTLLGPLTDSSGSPIVNQGLWGLAFGNGSFEQGTDTLYFTAGIPGPDSVESHGLFGSLQVAVPEPLSFWLCAGGLAVLVMLRFAGATVRHKNQ